MGTGAMPAQAPGPLYSAAVLCMAYNTGSAFELPMQSGTYTVQCMHWNLSAHNKKSTIGVVS